MKKLLLVAVLAALGAWDAAAQETREPQEARRDTASIRIDEVVVAARGRNRARRYFRRYVRKVPPHGWYVGFAGAYSIDTGNGFQAWRSKGTYIRNHIPGDDANRHKTELFTLNPDVAADSINAWHIRRYVLLASSIAERAAAMGYESEVAMSYRGSEDGMNVFLMAEPGDNAQRHFRTRILVHETSGLIGRSESVSRAPGGEWSVTARYAMFDGFIYPTEVAASFEQPDPISGLIEAVKVEMTGITPRRFERDPITKKYWQDDGEPPKKVLEQRRSVMRKIQPK